MRGGFLVAFGAAIGVTQVLGANSPYDVSWSGRLTVPAGNCFSSADLTVKDGQVTAVLHGKAGGLNLNGSIRSDGTAIMLSPFPGKDKGGKVRTMYVTFKGDSFELRGSLGCGDVVYGGARASR